MERRSLKKRIIKALILATCINILIGFSSLFMLLYHSVHKVDMVLGALALYFFSLGLVILTTNKLANYFLAPLQDIVRGIQEIQSGNTDYKIKINTNDEFEDIGEMINVTSDIIREHQKTIENSLQKEKRQKLHLFKVYSDVISSVTQGRFNLLKPCEVLLFSIEGDLWGKMPLEKPEDVNKARELVKQVLMQKQCSVQNLMHLQLCVSEAATNVLKHAGFGELEIRKANNLFRIIVSDNGPGMDYDKLPNMIFLQGFSTKISMGVGLSLIYKYTTKVYLSTSENGTHLILDFSLK